jgi:tellurite resistance protein
MVGSGPDLRPCITYEGLGCKSETQIMVQKPTDADWILKAMVAVAGADGRLDAREVGLIQKVYQDQTGRSVDVSGVVLAVQAYATKRDVLTELSAAAGSMSRETKEKIIRAAYLTLLADKRIAGEERKRLKDIAAALQISEIHFDAIEETEPTSGEERS